jgi:hypothetical protein
MYYTKRLKRKEAYILEGKIANNQFILKVIIIDCQGHTQEAKTGNGGNY